jgi:hypothetical protein
MKELLIGLLAVGSISSFASLPSQSGDIYDTIEIEQIISGSHDELIDPQCVVNNLLNQPIFKKNKMAGAKIDYLIFERFAIRNTGGVAVFMPKYTQDGLYEPVVYCSIKK